MSPPGVFVLLAVGIGAVVFVAPDTERSPDYAASVSSASARLDRDLSEVRSVGTDNADEVYILGEPSDETDESSLFQTATAYEWLTVSRIVDGDTFVVIRNGSRETVRMIGIDTPEVAHPRKSVECFGREASERATALLSGARVRLELDPTQGERDRHGRILAYVFLRDGTLVNRLLVEEGYAREYTYRAPYAYQTNFRAMEARARFGEKGLWSSAFCQ